MALPSLHPTAVVDPSADLGPAVTVGPYAVIEGGVSIGAETAIGPHVVIRTGADLGAGCRIHAGAVIADDPQDLGFDPARPTRLVIGPRTVIREHATIHRATRTDRPTRVGADCLIMAHAHIAHDAQIGQRVILCNSALVAGHVELHDRAFLSGNTVVHQFCRVGEGVMLSGVSGVNRDVGPYLMVAERGQIVGLNTVGLRRAGLPAPRRRAILAAYRALFSASTLEAGLAAVRALEGSDEPEIRRIMDFYQGSRRGYARPRSDHPLSRAGALESLSEDDERLGQLEG